MTRRPIKYIIWIAVLSVAGLAAYLGTSLLRAQEPGENSEASPNYYTLKGDIIEATDSAAAAAGVRVEKVALSDAPMTLTLTAKSGLNMETVTHVSPQFAGKVVDIGVGLGDRVRGPEDGVPTKLCVIESNDLAQDKANWLQALIQVRIDEEALKRTQELYQANVLAEKFLLDAESALMKDQSAQEAARQQLLIFGLKDNEIDATRLEAMREAENVKAGSQPAGGQVEKSTEQIRRDRMGYVISCPRTGTVAEKLVSGGEMGTPGNNLFTIADTKTMWVWGDVYERDLPRVKVGQPMKVYFTSEPDRARQCTVDWISPVLDPATHAVKIRGVIDNSDGHLLSDMYGTMSITVSDGKNSLLLPADAILHERNEAHPEKENEAFVFVEVGISSGKTQYRRTPVTVLPLQAGFGVSQPSASASSAAKNEGSQTQPSNLVCIPQGIHAGDRVVVSGCDGLFNEMKLLASAQQGNGQPVGAGSPQASLSMKQ